VKKVMVAGAQALRPTVTTRRRTRHIDAWR
jgi:hypothetical protein